MGQYGGPVMQPRSLASSRVLLWLPCAGTLQADPMLCPDWGGIDCDNATGRVAGINLAARQFACDLSQNGCQLPQQLFSADVGLTALQRINLSHTSFALNISSVDLSGMRLLKALDLRHMPNLVGALQPAWQDWMPNLQELYLSGMQTVVSALTSGPRASTVQPAPYSCRMAADTFNALHSQSKCCLHEISDVGVDVFTS